MNENISSDFPFESQFVTVEGSQIHFVEQGQGDPILLVHGNPTSSYLWRNVIPHLSGQGRCIALDLIGMGKSDKPDIPYRLEDHYQYFKGFIAALGLKNIRLVVHDWGGFLGFRYAAEHPENVAALAFMEAVIRPVAWEDRSDPFQKTFKMFRGEKGWEKLVDENFFIERVLPGSVVRKMTETEMDTYRAPFTDPPSRKPVYVFPNEIPIGGEPADVTETAHKFISALSIAGIPMLLLHFLPGAIILTDDVEWAERTFPTLTTKEMGKGIHFVQEDQPGAIGQAIDAWLKKIGQ